MSAAETYPLINDAAAFSRSLSRWLDNEAGIAEEQRMLEYGEAHPVAWREWALACVSERAIAGTAGSWLRGSEHIVSDATVPGDKLAVAMSDAKTSQNQSRSVSLPAAEVAPTNRVLRGWGWIIGIAAAFLLGLIIRDYRPTDLLNETPRPGPNAMVTASPTGPNSTTQPGPANNQPINQTPLDPAGLRIQLVSDQGTPSAAIDVPLYDAARLDEASMTQLRRAMELSLPQNILQELEQEGQVVRQQNSWMPVKLPNGRQALVPIQRVRIEPRANLAQ